MPEFCCQAKSKARTEARLSACSEHAITNSTGQLIEAVGIETSVNLMSPADSVVLAPSLSCKKPTKPGVLRPNCDQVLHQFSEHYRLRVMWDACNELIVRGEHGNLYQHDARHLVPVSMRNADKRFLDVCEWHPRDLSNLPGLVSEVCELGLVIVPCARLCNLGLRFIQLRLA